MAVTCSFSYYLINFYVKYLPGNIYTNQTVNSWSECIAHLLSLWVLKLFSIKNGYFFSYLLCALSALVVILSEYSGVEHLIPIAVLGAKAGISVAFCFLYFTTVNYFESKYLGLVMGFSNVSGRMSTIAAPIVAELPDPVPMLSVIVLCFLSLIASHKLQLPSVPAQEVELQKK